MILTSDMYVPALRWRLGEYQALSRLSSLVQDRVVPFITIPEIEFDFAEQRPKKSVQEHIRPFAARYKAQWGKRPAWIAVHPNIVEQLMEDGRDIFTYVFDELRPHETSAIPAIPLLADERTIFSVAAIIEKESRGVAISLRLEDLMQPSPGESLEALTAALRVAVSDTDLIVDLGAPNFEPYDVFAGALITVLHRLCALNLFRNFVLIGTAIPETFASVAKGGDEIPRHDWLFYQILSKKLPEDLRQPNFGDYTIVHPNFAPIDMRKMKPAGKLIYTAPCAWFVCKGGSFRDNPNQMHDHCAATVSSAVFRGAGYSSGDDYIAKCAVRKEGPSNQTKWKDMAINHHITHVVVDDLATLGAAP